MKKISKNISLLLICAMVLMLFPTAIFGQEYEYIDETLAENQQNEVVKEINESDMLLYASTDEENMVTSVVDNIEESEQNENLVVEEGLSTSSTEYTDDNYKYIIEGGGATITKYLGSEGAVVIPDTIEGYQVLKIGKYAFNDKDTIGKITLGSYVTRIGDYAFRGCNALGSVLMNNGLKEIGYGAFVDCTALSSVVIPDSVTTLTSDTYSDGLFQGCTALTKVVLGSGVTKIPRCAFYKCSALSSVVINGPVTTIERSAFNSCSLSNINLPDSVVTIEMRAFYDCDNLTSINLPASLETIGDEAFYDCAGLKACNFNNSLKTIGLSAFYNCDALISVEVPDSVTSLVSEPYSWKEGTFQDCDSLKTVVIGSGVTYLPYNCFKSCDLLSAAEINGNATTIGNRAFQDCVNLTEINLPQSLTMIGAESFENCQALTQITIPDQVAIVSEECFKDCTGLKSVTFGNNVTSISRSAFYGCTSLSDVTFNNSLTNIQGGAFGKCSSLTEVSLPSSLTSIFTTQSWNGGGAFENCKSLTKVVIPESVTQINEGVFKNSPVTIYGLNGSYAQEYAKTNGLQFEAISSIDKPLNILSFSADKSSGQKVGTAINLTVSVEGGTAPYQYKFYYMLGSAATTVRDFSTTNTATFKPTAKGDFSLIVEVKDALGHSATKSINMKIIDAGGSGGEPKLISYLGKDSSGNYYRYSVTEFNNSYLAYQFKPSLPAAKMYQQFLNSKCKIVGLEDQAKGYMDYAATASASLKAQMMEQPFDINVYFASSAAKLYEETVDHVKIVDKDGNVS